MDCFCEREATADNKAKLQTLAGSGGGADQGAGGTSRKEFAVSVTLTFDGCNAQGEEEPQRSDTVKGKVCLRLNKGLGNTVLAFTATKPLIYGPRLPVGTMTLHDFEMNAVEVACTTLDHTGDDGEAYFLDVTPPPRFRVHFPVPQPPEQIADAGVAENLVVCLSFDGQQDRDELQAALQAVRSTGGQRAGGAASHGGHVAVLA